MEFLHFDVYILYALDRSKRRLLCRVNSNRPIWFYVRRCFREKWLLAFNIQTSTSHTSEIYTVTSSSLNGNATFLFDRQIIFVLLDCYRSILSEILRIRSFDLRVLTTSFVRVHCWSKFHRNVRSMDLMGQLYLWNFQYLFRNCKMLKFQLFRR